MVGIHTRCWSRKAEDIGNDIKGQIGLLHKRENRRFHDSYLYNEVQSSVYSDLVRIVSSNRMRTDCDLAIIL